MNINDDMYKNVDTGKYSVSALHSMEEVQESFNKISTATEISDSDREYYQKMLDSNICVALELIHRQNDVVNTAGVIILGHEEDGRLWIEYLVLHPDYRLNGLSAVTLEIIISIAKSNNFRLILVDFEEQDEDESYFYEALGFEVAGILKGYYPDGSAACIMSMLL